ncbi:MAG: putative membrane protein YfcA [Bacteroidia bacterium]|jgi:uncharacterized membrane protein YfcA
MLNALFFFLIAILYASVGFGGGSGYIAILSFCDLPPSDLRFVALCCNIVAVSGGTYLFIKNQTLSITKALPFVVTSVPMAFIGGSIQLGVVSFYLLLAITLFIAGILMFIQSPNIVQPKSSNQLLNAGIGAVIGLVSGLVGIGGGIFLAPLLYLMKWDKAKTIAATASLFILVNSIAGLAGQIIWQPITVRWSYLIPLLLAVAVGGQIGSRVNIKWLSPIKVKRLTAVLVIFASVRMLFKLIA